MKFQSLIRLFLPIPLLLMVAVVACTQDDGQQSTPVPLPSAAPTEAPRPLTADERAAIDEFEAQLQSIDNEWQELYDDFDAWRGGLVECHPGTAREALRGLAASFAAVAEQARALPRTSSTSELADLVIAATDSEETALRQLRDRWRAGNITLFETVEQRRTESALVHNTAADMSLSKQQELRDGPTLDQIDEMEAFSKTFDAIADDWDDFHDSYAAFAKRESKLEMGDRATGYAILVIQLDAVMTAINALEASQINEDIVDALQEAAEDEVAALQFLADFPPDLTAEMSGSQNQDPSEEIPPMAPSTASTASGSETQVDPRTAQATQPAAPDPSASSETQGDEAPAPPSTAVPATRPAPRAQPSAAETKSAPQSPIEELMAAISDTESLLEELEQSIDDIVNDESARSLEDLDAFDEQLELFLVEWEKFYETYNEWRSSDGGCDSVEVGGVLSGYSQQAAGLARMVDDLPQSGLLLPVFTLAVAAAELESGAIRTLASNWSPFAIDAFKAVDDERVNARRLRRQASIALEELGSRP